MAVDPITDFDAFQAELARIEGEADWQALARTLREALHDLAIADAPQVGGRPKSAVESELWGRLGRLYRDRLGDTQAATTVFELLAARDPRDVEARAALAALRGEGILAALVAGDGRPRTVAALAGALGLELTLDDALLGARGTMALPPEGHPPLSGDVTSVSVTYDWDMFHEYPVATLEDLLRRTVREWTAVLAHPIAAVETVLTSAFGPPRLVASSRVFGSWIATSTSNASTALSFYPKLPDWAVAAPDTATRERALVELAATIAAGQDRTVLDRAAASIPPSCGLVIEARVAPSPGHVPKLAIELVPAMPAPELARVLGWPRPVGRTLAFHRDSWHVWLATDADGDAPRFERPSFGGWSVTATLDGHPRGRPLDPAHRGPIGDAYELTSEDLVRSLHVG